MAIHVSCYGSHDASICFCYETNKYRIYEIERIAKKRYADLKGEDWLDLVKEVKRLFEAEYGAKEYASLFYGELSPVQVEDMIRLFDFNHTEEIEHHKAHAAGALYQSDFEKAIIISSDSGGNELHSSIQTFCVFHGDKSEPMNQVVKRLAKVPLDACGAYTLMAIPIKEIYKEDLYSRYLSYAGKIMGLAAYGNVITEWIKPMMDFYYGLIDMEHLKELGDKIGLDLSNINTIEGKDAYNLAATSQRVFELVTINAIQPFIGKYRLPVIMTGGGALNVLLNEIIRNNTEYGIDVPVNPNDCGLSFGMMVLRDPPTKNKVTTTYDGVGILDIDKLSEYVEKYGAKTGDEKDVARIICRGKIVGVMRGNSEVGPRALGNRSIFCLPNLPDGKNRLNKLKQREFFRPFAPVVRKKDVEKYFWFKGESEFMSFAPNVNAAYVKALAGITHRDSTARVQTVTLEQNEWLYELVNAVDTITGIGVILNTSLNIKGKPILTTIEDAIKVWQETEMDCLVIENYIFKK